MLKKSTLTILLLLITALVVNTSAVVAQGPEDPFDEGDSTEQTDTEDLSDPFDEGEEVAEPESDLADEESVADPTDEGDAGTDLAVEEDDSVADPFDEGEEVLDDLAEDDSVADPFDEGDAGTDLAIEEDDSVADPFDEGDGVVEEEVIEDLAANDVTSNNDVSTSALPGGGWFTGHTIANVGTGEATLSVQTYGSESQTYSSTIPEGSSVTWLPDDFGFTGASFDGAAIATSSTAIRGIVNVTNRSIGSYGVTGGEAAAQYRGIDSPDTTASFPIVKFEYPAGNANRQNTTLYLQNAGSSATTISVNFVGTGCSPCTYTSPSIGAGERVAISASDAGASAGFIGSATATSSENIAGAFVEAHYNESPATQAKAATAFTTSQYDDTILVPVYKYDLGSRSTGLQVQNVGTVDVSVTVTYTGDRGDCAGSTYTVSSSIAQGDSVTFLEGKDFTNGTATSPAFPTNCLASAKVVATASSGTPQIVATVSESFYPVLPSGTSQQSTIYTAFGSSSATSKVSLPVVKHESGSKTTGVTCQNTSSTSANVTYKYISGGDTFTSDTMSIDGNGSATITDHTNEVTWSGSSLSKGTLSSVTVSSDQPIVCIANESVWPPSNPLAQDKINYEGFNLE